MVGAQYKGGCTPEVASAAQWRSRPRISVRASTRPSRSNPDRVVLYKYYDKLCNERITRFSLIFVDLAENEGGLWARLVRFYRRYIILTPVRPT